MRPNQNRRGRNHNHGHRNGNNNGRRNNGNAPVRFQTFESKGLEVKVRGNPSQIYEKYMSLARDSMSSGDLIRAESHYQHAEHYFRLLNSEPRPQFNPQEEQGAPAEGDGVAMGEAVVESMVPPVNTNVEPPEEDKTDAA